ncbi:methyltransferase domain-containing protein [Temperatibacter marinus]|uniref:Methyltransferase domain-containing protein n=1 Tax=Temperatibacter marinus TaxID=1456591 RepID=A0AA52EHJ4_9PROT|nr:methyltransferase domain-containing protein [Temperatibacter marinus]WND02186.1 methyltransferase domain-containing protein [Temperatibacter marinus]
MKSLLDLYNLERYSDAEKYAKSLTNLFPNNNFGWKILAAVFKKTNRHSAAVEAGRKAIEISPNDTEAHCNLGNTLLDIGHREEAMKSYLTVTKLDPNHAAKHLVASMSGENTKGASKDYVKWLFDGYAENFEQSLVDTLDYSVPHVLADLIFKENEGKPLGKVLDLGCGTGLFGQEILNQYTYLEGIDLSVNMLNKAAEKEIYDTLVSRDILEYLSQKELCYDYFIAADVFVYIGDLSEIFKQIKKRNKKGARLAFSTEELSGDSYRLQPSGRYAHSKDYIQKLCKQFDYKILKHHEMGIRKDENVGYIPGALYLLGF